MANTIDIAKLFAINGQILINIQRFSNIAKSLENNWDELTTYFRYSKAISKPI